MNQILITQNDNQKKEKKVKNKMNAVNINSDISKIIKVFAILILIFGLALSGSGVYAIMQNIEETKNTISPDIDMQRIGNAITIFIKCNTGIRTISYSWNESPEKVVQGRNQTELEQQLTVPSGESKLYLSVIDSKGKQFKFVKNFIQAEKDKTEPVINFEVVNSNIKIVVTDDTALDYIVYKYGDEQEVRIGAEQEGQATIEATIPVSQGQNKLVVEAVDKAQNFATKEQEIKGAKKPTIEVTSDVNDPSYIIIKAYDEEGLRMVSYYINGQEYKTDPNTSLNTKTFEWRQKVEPGENNVIVHAYNINELVTEFVGIYNYR